MELIQEVKLLNDSISEYCITKCKSKCCKNGKLPLKPSEFNLFDKNKIDERGCFDLKDGCKYLDLKTNKCGMYIDRPNMCRTFPFILKNQTIYALTFCPAVSEGIVYDSKKIKSEHFYFEI